MTALQPTLQRVGGQEKSNHRVGFSAASTAATVLSLQGAEEAGGGRGRPGAKVRPCHGFRGRPWVFQTFRLQGPAAGAAHPPAGPAPVSPSLSFFTEEVDIGPLLTEQRKHFSSCVLVCERLRGK